MIALLYNGSVLPLTVASACVFLLAVMVVVLATRAVVRGIRRVRERKERSE
jgi:hypothetical protein